MHDHVWAHLPMNLVDGFQDELDEAALGLRAGRLLDKLPCLGHEPEVAPEPACKLLVVELFAVHLNVQLCKLLKCEGPAVLRC